MPCVLHVEMRRKNIGKLLSQLLLKPHAKHNANEIKNLAKNISWTTSGFSVDTSKADFSDFRKQVRETIKFLQKNQQDLFMISQAKDLKEFKLDFGINAKNEGFYNFCDYLPPKLLLLAGNLGITIEISVYRVEK
jgi:hypothetical protein